MTYRWQLAIYTEDLEATLPLADYLQQRSEGRAGWDPSLEDSTVILEAEGREWLACSWNLGNLGLMIYQYEAARKRLAQGLPALIRSAVDDYSDVPFLMFEPIASTEVSISLFFIEDLEMRLIYPVVGNSAHIQRLYDHVEANRAHLLGPVKPGQAGYTFRRLRFPSGQLLKSLEREAKLGRHFYALLGREMPQFRSE